MASVAREHLVWVTSQFSTSLFVFLLHRYRRRGSEGSEVALVKLGRENIGGGNSNRASTKVHTRFAISV